MFVQPALLLKIIDVRFTHEISVRQAEPGLRTTENAISDFDRIEDKNDFFHGKTEQPVIIEAVFDCPQPTPEQAIFICRQTIRVRCTYPFGDARIIEVLQLVAKDKAFTDVGGQSVADLRSTLNTVGVIEDGDKPSKSDAQKLLKNYVATSLGPDEFVEEWGTIVETELAKLLPDFVLVSVDRSLDSALKMTDSSLFGKLFRPLLKETMAEIVEEDALADVRSKLKLSVQQRVAELQSLMQQQMNNDTVCLTHDVDIDPLKGLIFDFGMDDERATGIPISNRGAGVHNNLTLAMFRLLAEHKAENFILAIEEPENSLHPRGQREMLWALQDLARTAQVICTTHSSVFLDLGQLEDNIVLSRTAKGNTVARTFQGGSPDVVGALREILGIRISDALLSGGGNCALIVEGATELHAYPHFFTLVGHNARALGVSIITAEGSDTHRMRHILRVLNVYDIPAVIVLDKDAEKTYDDLKGYGPGGELPNLRKVHLLSQGTFETYIPLPIALEVINDRFDGDEITEEHIDLSKDRLKEFGKTLHAHKGITARFEFFKVQFGQLVGEKMVKQGCTLHDEIAAVIEDVKSIAEEV